ncbi:MAG: EAL domain-containing protein [Sphaerochaetaceae bacterium]|nr:EAL domain-containing protein [Sphaerochaetaceae bacterium]
MRNILIVDDNQINREILKRILSKEYKTIEAANGQIALDFLKEDKNKLSAVLLDINMPIMNGNEFLEEYKKNTSIKRLPIIVLTQKEGVESEVEALSLGATDFLTKPYNPRIILHRLRSLIALQEASSKVSVLELDSLTGLYSKIVFVERTKLILQKYKDKKFKILLFDFENFKLINDLFGIQAGDKILKEFAECLKSVKVDTINLIGRLVGNQFVVFTELENISFILRKWLEDFIDRYSDKIKIHIRIGCYIIEDTTIPIEVMCSYARSAADMNRGKFENKVCFYDEYIRNKMLEEQMVLNEMETAIEKEQFVVYYQPKYNLFDNTLFGAEALVRWVHPTKGLMYPGQFIPIFEKNGFITNLDIYVWEKTCQDLKRLEDKLPSGFSFSVNVSRVDIYNPNLINILIGLIKKYNIKIENLHLEITESAYMDDSERLIGVVTKLRDLGFIIEMDDFGSGYSSLNMLIQVPVDIIKLDMFFLSKKSDQKKKNQILKFILNLARGMDLKVIAEGIETEEDKTTLMGLGCSLGQGFLLDRPLQIMDFENRLEINQSLLTLGIPQYCNSIEVQMHKMFAYDEMPFGIATFNKTTGNLILINKAFLKLLSYPEEDRYEYKKISNLIFKDQFKQNLDLQINKLEEERKEFISFQGELIDKKGLSIFCTFFLSKFVYNNFEYLQLYIFKNKEVEEQENCRLINQIPGGVYKVRFDDNKKISLASDNFYKIIGYTPEEYKDKFKNDVEKFVYYNDRKEFLKVFEEGEFSGIRILEYRIISRDGNLQKVMEVRHIVNKEQNVKSIVAFVFLISSGLINDVETVNQKCYKMIIPFIRNFLFEWDKKTDTAIFSNMLANEFDIDSVIKDFSKKLLKSNLIEIKSKNEFKKALSLVNQGIDFQEFDGKVLTQKGNYNWYKFSISSIKDSVGDVQKIIGYLSDITKQKNDFSKIKILAEKDALTNLLNHRTFQQKVEEKLLNIDSNCAFAMMDLDDFKKTNDIHGHYCGDFVLKEVSNRIESVTTSNVYLSRIGGDEFSAFFYNLKDKNQLEEILKSVREVLSKPMLISPTESYLQNISIGAVFFNNKANLSFKDCYKKSDMMMYEVKRQGKDFWKIEDLTKED